MQDYVIQMVNTTWAVTFFFWFKHFAQAKFQSGPYMYMKSAVSSGG